MCPLLLIGERDFMRSLAKIGMHYENTPMQYTVIFHSCKNDNDQNIDRGYTLEPPQ